MRRIVLPLLLGLLLLSLASPAAAANPHDRQSFSQSGFWADAYWDTCSVEPADTCTSVSLNAFSGARSDTLGGRPTRSSAEELCYGIQTYDPTGGGEGPFTYTYGCAGTAVTFAGDLSTATATATIPLQTCTFDPATGMETCTSAGSVVASVTWTAIGPLETFRERFTSTNTFDGMTCTHMYAAAGSRRFATATATVDGVSLGDADFAMLNDGRHRSSFSCR